MKDRSPVQLIAVLAAAGFLLVGMLGFVPGITSSYADLAFAGHQSQALLLGLFQISILHNLVHALFGVVGLVAARTAGGARGFLLGAGGIYLVLTVFGLFVPHGSAANFVPVNAADNWLHLALGLVMIGAGAGLALAKSGHRPAAAPRR